MRLDSVRVQERSLVKVQLQQQLKAQGLGTMKRSQEALGESAAQLEQKPQHFRDVATMG